MKMKPTMAHIDYTGLPEQHWEWLEGTLSHSTADWIIVAGHYPVWSASTHGNSEVLLQRLRPLMKVGRKTSPRL
jgi:phosphodiesterase/alkaline phosphatase D-like protein